MWNFIRGRLTFIIANKNNPDIELLLKSWKVEDEDNKQVKKKKRSTLNEATLPKPSSSLSELL